MNNSGTRRIISVILFIIYSCVLIYFLFFSDYTGRMHRTMGYSYNLILFKEIKRFIKYREILGMRSVIMNIGGNVAAFIPFGLFIIPVSNRKLGLKEVLILTFDVSLSVEIIQLFTKVGSFDVDDLLLNTIGGLIGIGLYFLWKFIERKIHNVKA